MNKDLNSLWQWVTKTPIGPLWASASQQGIKRLAFADSYELSPFALTQMADFHRRPGEVPDLEASLDLWLRSYFDKDIPLKTPPLDIEGTQFQRAVWSALTQIPTGATISYSQLAHSLGSRAYRAVGSAVGANPLPLIIPCHRVLPLNGDIGNYAFGASRKAWLLERESLKA